MMLVSDEKSFYIEYHTDSEVILGKLQNRPFYSYNMNCFHPSIVKVNECSRSGEFTTLLFLYFLI